MTRSAPRLVLGSGSPRRLEVLAQLGIVPDRVNPPDVDETPRKAELPRDYCRRVTRDKALAVQREPGEIALVADTTVALGRRILGKPEDADEARAFLTSLSGRRHRVITAVAVVDDAGCHMKDVVSQVRMKRLSARDLDAYIETQDWQGKAGGYAIQGPAGAFVPWISGSYSAIMGLPAYETSLLLQGAGYPLRKGAA